MNTEYYFENSIGILCNKKSEAILEDQLKDKRCSQCSSKLAIITYMEGTCVVCLKDNYHQNGYKVDEGNYDELPKIVKRS